MNEIMLRNNVRIFGEGEKTIIFAHGFGCDQNIWKYVTPHFTSEYRIILFDYVGSGKSDIKAYQPERYKTLHGYAQDLREILEALQVDSAVFIGHSVSGMIGVLTSIQRPDLFKCLIMIGPSPRYLNDEPEYFGGFNDNDVKEILDIMEMNFVGWASLNAPILIDYPERLSQQLESSFIAQDPVIMRYFAEATFLSDHRKELLQVTVPSLILQCAEDSIVPIQVGHYLHKNLQNSTLHVIDAKGHYPCLSHPDETAGVIKDYLAQLN